MTAGVVVLILAALLGIQPVTTDLYLPALPALTEGFGAGMSQAQLTLTALLLAFGLSQLVCGPLSDRFGRRPVLLVGLCTYTVAAIGSAMAPTMEQLVIWRTVQGVAMGAGVMCARAIVRDLYDPQAGARVMSKALSGLGVIACMSAPIGGLLTDLFSWRVALLTLAVFSAASLLLVAMRFQETLAHAKPGALAPFALARSWWHIALQPDLHRLYRLVGRQLRRLVHLSGGVVVRVHPGVGAEQDRVRHADVHDVDQLYRRHLPVPQPAGTLGARRSVAIASGMTLTSGTLIGVFALLGWSSGPHGAWFIIVPFYLYMMAHGIHQPCSQSGAVGPFPRIAGTASALNGFIMMIAAFAMGGWLGWRMDGTVFALTNGLWFWCVLIATAGWTLVQKHGVPKPDPS